MNKYNGIGYVVADPYFKINEENINQSVAKYRIGINRKHGDGTDFISCLCFGKNAEFASKYIRKGMKIGITGQLHTSSYQQDDGTTKYSTDVLVEEHEFCSSKKETDAVPNPVEAEGFVNIPDDIEADMPFE